MTDAEITSLHNQVLGEALYASALAQGVFVLVTQKWEHAHVIQVIDAMLLALERNQGSLGNSTAAIEHARVRMTGLLSAYTANRNGAPR